jgi:hypothetical protein
MLAAESAASGLLKIAEHSQMSTVLLHPTPTDDAIKIDAEILALFSSERMTQVSRNSLLKLTARIEQLICSMGR